MDLTLAGYVLDPGGSFDLSTLSVKYGQLDPLAETGATKDDLSLMANRILQLGPKLEAQLNQADLSSLYLDLELPLAFVLAKMEVKGLLCSPTTLKALSDEMEVAWKGYLPL